MLVYVEVSDSTLDDLAHSYWESLRRPSVRIVYTLLVSRLRRVAIGFLRRGLTL